MLDHKPHLFFERSMCGLQDYNWEDCSWRCLLFLLRKIDTMLIQEFGKDIRTHGSVLWRLWQHRGGSGSTQARQDRARVSMLFIYNDCTTKQA